MDNSFLFQENEFKAFSLEHGLPILIIVMIGATAMYFGIKTRDRHKQKRILFILSLFPAFSMVAYIFIQLITGNFTLAEDLPIHICRFVGITAPFVIWFEKRFWLGVFYFWCLVGTSNAVITPDLIWGFPHWNYFVYFILHVFLVLLPIYYTIVMKIRITLRDLWNAFWTANVFLVFTLLVNSILGSNYMFTHHKPPVETLMDSLGPWPWYLVVLQFLALVLFFLVYLPFIFIKKK